MRKRWQREFCARACKHCTTIKHLYMSHKERKEGRQTDRKKGRQTDRQTGRQRQKERQTEKERKTDRKKEGRKGRNAPPP